MGSGSMIAVGGENLIDLIVDGETREAVVGGSPLNVAMALARQGADVAYISPISTDDWGRQILARAVASGVRHVGERRAEPTTMAIATKDGGRVDYTFEREGTAEVMVSLEALRAVMPAEAAAFHVGSLALVGGDEADAWADLCEEVRGAGGFVSIDPNLRPLVPTDKARYRARLDRAMASADLLKLSDEDLALLYPGDEFEAAAAKIRALSGAVLVVVTLGAEGAVGYLGEAVVRVPAPKPEPFRDAVGAGDTFMATLLACLAERGALDRAVLAGFGQEDVRAVMTRAAMAAKLNCEEQGCVPPTRAALMAALG